MKIRKVFDNISGTLNIVKRQFLARYFVMLYGYTIKVYFGPVLSGNHSVRNMPSLDLKMKIFSLIFYLICWIRMKYQ